jgi:outer membrane receptor for monomeric catechols
VLAQDSITDDDLDDDVLLLSPFEVEASTNVGYLATQTLAGTRIKTDLKDVGSAISVVTKEMLRDTGATDNQTLLAYTTNTEVGGTTGNFAGFVGDDSDLDETDSLINPNQNTRVRGLTSADNTRDYFLTNTPWDGFNTERVDMQRGPNAMLYGLGSPAGIINSSSNQAYFEDSGGNLSLRFDRWGGSRASVDYNQVILEDELAVRVDVLKDNGRYRQKQAYENDQRFYITSRYAPKFLNTDQVSTQFRVNYEHGEIDANRPRTLTPTDLLTAWWDELDQEGVDPIADQDEGGKLDVDGGNYQAWYGGIFANAYGGVLVSTDSGSDTSTVQAAKIYGAGGMALMVLLIMELGV